MVQRDNIWHPYYEHKLDEEDLGAKYRANLLKAKGNPTKGTAIEDIEG